PDARDAARADRAGAVVPLPPVLQSRPGRMGLSRMAGRDVSPRPDLARRWREVRDRYVEDLRPRARAAAPEEKSVHPWLRSQRRVEDRIRAADARLADVVAGRDSRRRLLSDNRHDD